MKLLIYSLLNDFEHSLMPVYSLHIEQSNKHSLIQLKIRQNEIKIMDLKPLEWLWTFTNAITYWAVWISIKYPFQ